MQRLRNIGHIILKTLLYSACFLLVYLAVMLSLAFIPVNTVDIDTAEDITIYIKSNGVHADIILPVKNEITDWREIANPLLTVSKDSTFRYAAFGWGDRDFYLNTPQWSDLKAKTAIKAAFYMGKGAMHVTFYHKLRQDELCKEIKISKAEYKNIVSFVSSSFSRNAEGNTVIIQDAGYGARDLFYAASGKYSLFYTCNSWTNNALKAGGQKAALWTLTDSGILVHY